jgi:multidrug efflux pump subunit AcrA (membrane-fusion protein)
MHPSWSLTAAFVACTSLSLLFGCKPADTPAAAEIRPVRTITIEKRAGGGSVGLTGTVQAQTEVNLAFRIDGKLTERTVSVGDVVRMPRRTASRFTAASPSRCVTSI